MANLRDEISTFLKKQSHEFVNRFSDHKWNAKLFFLANFFSHVNHLNGSMQGKNKIILDVSEDIEALKCKENGRCNKWKVDCFCSI